MGWTSCHRESKISHKDFFSKEFNFENEIVKKTVLEACLVDSVVYLAIETFVKENNKKFTNASICIIKWNKKDYYNFSYKDIPETFQPYYWECPLKILKLLTPIDDCNLSEYSKNCAKEWRKNIESKKYLQAG